MTKTKHTCRGICGADSSFWQIFPLKDRRAIDYSFRSIISHRKWNSSEKITKINLNPKLLPITYVSIFRSFGNPLHSDETREKFKSKKYNFRILFAFYLQKNFSCVGVKSTTTARLENRFGKKKESFAVSSTTVFENTGENIYGNFETVGTKQWTVIRSD